MDPAALCAAIVLASSTGDLKLYDWQQQNACEYSEIIIDSAQGGGIDPVLLTSMIYIESRFSPKTVSTADACGLTQVVHHYSPYSCEELQRPSTAIPEGVRMLNAWRRYLVKTKRSTGLESVLACYASGRKCHAPGYVRAVKWVRRKISIALNR
jgi:hypothetical protein